MTDTAIQIYCIQRDIHWFISRYMTNTLFTIIQTRKICEVVDLRLLVVCLCLCAHKQIYNWQWSVCVCVCAWECKAATRHCNKTLSPTWIIHTASISRLTACLNFWFLCTAAVYHTQKSYNLLSCINIYLPTQGSTHTYSCLHLNQTLRVQFSLPCLKIPTCKISKRHKGRFLVFVPEDSQYTATGVV